MEAMGGKINISSRPEKGTTITLTLPIKEELLKNSNCTK
jgi:signal transduction histidine kinase